MPHINQAGSIVSADQEPANRISPFGYNSREASTIAPNGIFQGVGEYVSMYGRVGISMSASSPTSGTFTIEVSHDNVTWAGPTRLIENVQYAEPIMWNIVEKYFRIKFVNGNRATTDFSIQTHYSINANTLLGHTLDANLKTEHGALLTRSVIAGLQPDGTYANAQISSAGQLKVSSGGTPETLNNILLEMKLLNARFEEAFDTGINIGDVK